MTTNLHVGRHAPGAFPYIEMTCPCPKGRCGLAAPNTDIPCSDHDGTKVIRQAHDSRLCRGNRRIWWWKAALGKATPHTPMAW